MHIHILGCRNKLKCFYKLQNVITLSPTKLIDFWNLGTWLYIMIHENLKDKYSLSKERKKSLLGYKQKYFFIIDIKSGLMSTVEIKRKLSLRINLGF